VHSTSTQWTLRNLDFALHTFQQQSRRMQTMKTHPKMMLLLQMTLSFSFLCNGENLIRGCCQGHCIRTRNRPSSPRRLLEARFAARNSAIVRAILHRRRELHFCGGRGLASTSAPGGDNSVSRAIAKRKTMLLMSRESVPNAKQDAFEHICGQRRTVAT